MLTYIKNSFQKFGQDALSKVFYDIGKFALIALLAILITMFIPSDTSVGAVFNKTFSLSVLNFISIIVACIIVSVCIVLFIANRKYKILQKDNFTDELTGLFNHKALNEKMPGIIEVCKKQRQKLSLIMIDIDDFKKFNTETSYQIADKVLAKVGGLLKSDNRSTDTVFRQYLKGDEFIILAMNTELANANIAAIRKKDLFKTAIEIGDNTYRLTVSCGVTEFNFEDDNQESALLRLNRALVMAKAKPNKNSIETLI